MIIGEFEFQVEFIYQPIPIEERVDLSQLEANAENADEPTTADDGEQP